VELSPILAFGAAPTVVSHLQQLFLPALENIQLIPGSKQQLKFFILNVDCKTTVPSGLQKAPQASVATLSWAFDILSLSQCSISPCKTSQIFCSWSCYRESQIQQRRQKGTLHSALHQEHETEKSIAVLVGSG